MKRNIALLILLGLLLTLPGNVLAAPPVNGGAAADYDLKWWTVDGGGCIASTAGSYILSGTAGQPNAETGSTGLYALNGGVWGGMTGGGATGFRYLLPIVVKSH